MENRHARSLPSTYASRPARNGLHNMARRPRLHLPGGFYHVTLRGNHRQAIFRDDGDRFLLNAIFAEVIPTQGARVHAYCWMSNHVHALIQVSDVPLGRIILRIASRYARMVQASMSTTGHLFERRYHSTLVDCDRYLLAVIRYIHLNPVQAHLVAEANAYPWSSHRAYLGLSQCSWLTTEFVFGMLASDLERAHIAYRELMASHEPCVWGEGSLKPNPGHSGILGDEDFARRAAGHAWRPRSGFTVEMLVHDCCERFGIAPEVLTSPAKSRQLAKARAWLAHQVLFHRVGSINALALRLNRTEGSLRQLLSRYPAADTEPLQPELRIYDPAPGR